MLLKFFFPNKISVVLSTPYQANVCSSGNFYDHFYLNQIFDDIQLMWSVMIHSWALYIIGWQLNTTPPLPANFWLQMLSPVHDSSALYSQYVGLLFTTIGGGRNALTIFLYVSGLNHHLSCVFVVLSLVHTIFAYKLTTLLFTSPHVLKLSQCFQAVCISSWPVFHYCVIHAYKPQYKLRCQTKP